MYTRGNKRKLQAIQTKNKIFDTAHAMFKERGFYNVTVEEIAEAAGISVGSLYHHFKNKYALLTAWHDRLDEEYIAHYEEILRTPKFENAEAPVIIKEMILWIQDVCVNYGHEYISVVYSQMLSNIDFARIMSDHSRQYYKIFTELMTRGQKEGSIRSDLSVEQLVRDLTLISHGCMMDWAMEKSTATMREFSDIPLSCYLRGISTSGRLL